MPKISVVIPTYNRAQFILKAIESALNQTFRDLEIIVVDNASQDNTREVLRPYKDSIRYIYQENNGISAGRNRGIQEAKGEYIAFLDSDDYWVPEKTAEQVKILDENPQVAMVYSLMMIVNGRGDHLGLYPAKGLCRDFDQLLMTRGDIPTSVVMVRRECFSKAGLFDTGLFIGEDAEMWLRIARYYKIMPVENKIWGYYLRHDNQTIYNRINFLQGQVKTDIKIMQLYPQAPRPMLIKRVALNEYIIAKEYYDQGHYGLTVRHTCRALKHCFILGVLNFDPDDQLPNKLLKLIKPYGLLLVSSFKYLFSCEFLRAGHAK